MSHYFCVVHDLPNKIQTPDKELGCDSNVCPVLSYFSCTVVYQTHPKITHYDIALLLKYSAKLSNALEQVSCYSLLNCYFAISYNSCRNVSHLWFLFLSY